MYLEEKRKYLHIGLHPWTDGQRTLYGCGWGDGVARLSTEPDDAAKVVLELPEEELIERYTPVTQGIRYVVGYVLDQTLGYWNPEMGWTTKHPEVVVFDTLDEAQTVFFAEHADFIEAVVDVDEFRRREDTW